MNFSTSRVHFNGRFHVIIRRTKNLQGKKWTKGNLSEKQLLDSLISSSEADGTGTGADCAERNEAIRSTSALPRLRRGLVRPEPRLSIPNATAIPLVWRRRIRFCSSEDFNSERDDGAVAAATDRERIFSSVPVLTDLSQPRRIDKITRLNRHKKRTCRRWQSKFTNQQARKGISNRKQHPTKRNNDRLSDTN